MKSAARSSASPPISPIMTIALVSGRLESGERVDVGGADDGSPPMPMAVEKPISRSSYIIW
jgi:hypothetical protein